MLNTVIVIDYQNVNLVGLNLFNKGLQSHVPKIDPIIFSRQLLKKRESSQRSKSFPAVISKILVFSGLPSPTYDPERNAKALSQAARWQRNPKISTHHRPLKYEFKRNSMGKLLIDENGKKIIIKRKEKGIDVLCALALVREAQNFDLVILASQDSDLIPAIDEACSLGRAKIETFSWYSRENRRSKELVPERHRVWNTRMDELDYLKCLE